MSLEAQISELTDAVRHLTAVMQSGAVPGPAQAPAGPAAGPAADTTAKRTRKAPDAAKDTPPSTGSPAAGSTTENVTTTGSEYPATNDGKTKSVKLQAGDPDGTRYFHIAKHSTVAAIKPGEPIPSIGGIVECDGDEYAALKAKYTTPSQQDAPTGASAETPATASGAASPASSSAPATSQPVVDGPALVELCKKLHARDGNEGLKKVLDHFKVSKVSELITKTLHLPEIAKFIEGLLNPPAAAPSLF